MTWEEFRRRVLEEFGPGLEGASVRAVLAFCARMREEAFPSPRLGDAFVLPESAPTDWDDAQRGWFRDVLDGAAEPAAISLWLHAFEVWHSLREDDETPPADWLTPE